MTKQEKIRERIQTILLESYGTSAHRGKVSALEILATKEIIDYLHSQGVVIKVERELPSCDVCRGKGKVICKRPAGLAETYTCLRCNGSGKNYAGYVAVEPIK